MYITTYLRGNVKTTVCGKIWNDCIWNYVLPETYSECNILGRFLKQYLKYVWACSCVCIRIVLLRILITSCLVSGIKPYQIFILYLHNGLYLWKTTKHYHDNIVQYFAMLLHYQILIFFDFYGYMLPIELKLYISYLHIIHNETGICLIRFIEFIKIYYSVCIKDIKTFI